jgi:hypothetical protein
MAKHFPNLQTKAAAYAAMKDLERMLKEDGELPPGFNAELSGVTVEIKLPPGTSVTRDAGKKGDGRQEKKATQNLYGWAILYECFRVCRLFKQHKKLERVLMMIVRRAVNRAISSQEAFAELMPRRAEEIKELKDSLPVPMRDEPTPRMVNRNEAKSLPTVTVTFKKKAAA